jgi:hypothetical protein
LSSLLQTIFTAAYEQSPILLQNGIAQFLPGKTLPIIVITELFDFPALRNKTLFAHWKPVPGSSLEEWQIADYPFASLQVAANAVIQQPLKISMLMVCPAQNNGGYIYKQAILTAIKLALDTHISSGGTFTVITPAYTYSNCLLTSVRDVSSLGDKQVQYMYQFDFVQPLISQGTFYQKVLGTLMNTFTDGLPTPPNLGGSTGWNNTAPTSGAVPR